MHEECEKKDLARGPFVCLMMGATALLITGQALWPTGGAWLATAIFAMWGVFCSVNAARCGRLHCYITGPLCLLTAMAFALLGLGIIRFPGNEVALAVLAVAAISMVSEKWLGAYVERSRNS